MKHFDVVVVGCGAMGSSSSYNLARRGLSVLTLDRFSLNHGFGSSHGGTRIFRLAYFEDTRYVPLLMRALDAWREVEAESGRQLLKLNGGLMIGRSDGAFVSGVLRSALAQAVPHRVLPGREAMEMYPAFDLDEELVAVHDENAGILFPEECISTYVELAQRAGCTFGFGERATRWANVGEGLEVETNKGSYAADRLVVAAGPWTGQLLGDLIPLKIERQVPFWFPSSGERLFSPELMPIFIMEEGSGHYFYGLPDVGKGVKVARHHEGDIVNPESAPRAVTETDESPVREFVSRRLPRLNRAPISSTTCLYSNTPDFNFVIDLVPKNRNVVVVSACSGHGFKFSSVMGEIVADLAVGRARQDISFLGAGRFVR